MTTSACDASACKYSFGRALDNSCPFHADLSYHANYWIAGITRDESHQLLSCSSVGLTHNMDNVTQHSNFSLSLPGIFTGLEETSFWMQFFAFYGGIAFTVTALCMAARRAIDAVRESLQTCQSKKKTTRRRCYLKHKRSCMRISLVTSVARRRPRRSKRSKQTTCQRCDKFVTEARRCSSHRVKAPRIKHHRKVSRLRVGRFKRRLDAGHRRVCPLWSRGQRIRCLRVIPCYKQQQQEPLPQRPQCVSPPHVSCDNVRLSWLGGKGSAATRRKRREREQAAQPGTLPTPAPAPPLNTRPGQDGGTPPLSLLDAVEAIVRTTRLGALSETNFQGALLGLLSSRGVQTTPQRQQPPPSRVLAPTPTQQATTSASAQQQPSQHPRRDQDDGWQQVASRKATRQAQPKQPEQSNLRQVYASPLRTVQVKEQSVQSIQQVISSEWTKPPTFMTFDETLKAIEDNSNPKGDIVEVTWEQYDKIVDYAKAFGTSLAITMLWQGHKQANNDKQTSAWIRARSSSTGQFRPVQVTCEQVSNTCGPMPRPPKKVAISSTKDGDNGDCKIFLRVTAPECYRKIFSDSGKNDTPANIIDVIKRWEIAGLSLGQLTHGTWKRQWGTKGYETVGHLLLPPKVADLLLAKSGQRGVFCTRTRAGDTSYKQAPVHWITRQSNEEDEDYFRRVSEKSGPVRYRTGGSNDLGVDADSKDDASKAIKQHWRLQGAPSHWDDVDLNDFLEKQGWKDIKLHKRSGGRRPGSTATWFLQALPPGEDDMEIYEDSNGEFTIMVTTTSAPRRPPLWSEPLRPPRSQWGPYNASNADTEEEKPPPGKKPRSDNDDRGNKGDCSVTAEVSQSMAAPTQLDSPPENKRKEPESSEPQGSSDVNKPLPQQPSTIDEATQLGWTEFDAGGDGDCFFKAFVHSDARVRKLPTDTKSTEREACKLRVAAVAHMKDPKHYNRFKSFYQKEDVAALYQEVNQPAPKDFDDFLKLCAGKGFWANQLVIQAVSERTGVPIVIWNASSKKVDSDFYKLSKEEQQRQGRPRTQRVWHRGVVAPRFQDDFAVSKVNYSGVSLVLRNNHYVCLLPPQHDCELPRMWLRETNSLFPQIGGAGETNTPAKSSRSTATPRIVEGHRWGACTPSTTPRKSSSSSRWGPATPNTGVNRTPSPPRWGTRTPATTPSQSKTNRWGLATPATYNHRSGSKSKRQLDLVGSYSRGVKRSRAEADSNSTCRASSSASNRSHKPTSSTSSRVLKPEDPEVWTCKYCHVRLTAKTSKQMSWTRTNHLANRHPERKRNKSDTRRKFVTILVPSHKIPWSQRSWTCPVCDKGLPHCETRHQKECSAKAHYKQAHPRRKITRIFAIKQYCKRYQANKAAQPNYVAGKKALSDKLKANADKRREEQPDPHGHEVVVFDADMSQAVLLRPHRGKRRRYKKGVRDLRHTRWSTCRKMLAVHC